VIINIPKNYTSGVENDNLTRITGILVDILVRESLESKPFTVVVADEVWREFNVSGYFFEAVL